MGACTAVGCECLEAGPGKVGGVRVEVPGQRVEVPGQGHPCVEDMVASVRQGLQPLSGYMGPVTPQGRWSRGCKGWGFQRGAARALWGMAQILRPGAAFLPQVLPALGPGMNCTAGAGT